MVVRMGRPSSLLVHWLACFIIVQPPDKRAITRGGRWSSDHGVSYHGGMVNVA
jgi:hypothetical protein